jgi:hypothetical protein
MIAISKIVNVSGSNQSHGADGNFFIPFFKGIRPPLMSAFNVKELISQITDTLPLPQHINSFKNLWYF